MERMLEQKRPAAPNFGHPSGWTSGSALPGPVTHVNGGPAPLEIDHNLRTGTSTAINGNVSGHRVDNRELIHHTRSTIDQSNTVPQADLRANPYHADLAQRARNAVDSLRQSIPAIHPQVVQQLERFTTDRRGIDRANREELVLRHRTQGVQHQNAFVGAPANASTSRPTAVQSTSPPPAIPSARIEVIESTQQVGRAQPQISRAQQQSSGATVMNGRPRDQTAQIQQQNGRVNRGTGVTGTGGRPREETIQQNTRPQQQQAKKTFVEWKDVAENLELPPIHPGTGIVEPLKNPSVEARIVYTQYRIAELQNRTVRAPMETQFLVAIREYRAVSPLPWLASLRMRHVHMLVDWATASSFILPTAHNYPKLLEWVTTLKLHEASRSAIGPAVRNGVAADARASVSAASPRAQTTGQPEQAQSWPFQALAPTPLPPATRSPSIDVRATPAPALTGRQPSLEQAMPPAKALLALLALESKTTPPPLSQVPHILDTTASCDQGSSPRPSQQASLTEGARLHTTPALAGPSRSPQISPPREPSSKASLPYSMDASIKQVRSSPAGPAQEGLASVGAARTPPRHVPEERSIPLPLTHNARPAQEEPTPVKAEPVRSRSASKERLLRLAAIEKVTPSPVEVSNPVETAASLKSQVEMRLDPKSQHTTQQGSDSPIALGLPAAAPCDNRMVLISREDALPSSQSEAPVCDSLAEKSMEQLGASPRGGGNVALDKVIDPPVIEPHTSIIARQDQAVIDAAPVGVVNMRVIRSIPPNKMWVEIPVRKLVAKPRPKARPRSLSPRRFAFLPPEHAQERFNKSCVSKVLSPTLLKRCSLRQCHWDDCDAVLASEWQSERHFAIIHGPSAKLEKRHRDEVDAWACLWKECAGFYASQKDLEQHVRTIHLQEGLRCPYTTCPRPDERYSTVSHLETHIARNPLTHARQNVQPLTDLSVEFDHRIEVDVPRVIQRADLLPIKAPRSVWQSARQKVNAINRVQEFSFIDREDRRMRSGESLPPIDMPIAPVPVTAEEEDEVKSEEVPSDTILVKREEPLPYALRLADASVPAKATRKKLELEVVIEISRPLIEGS